MFLVSADSLVLSVVSDRLRDDPGRNGGDKVRWYGYSPTVHGGLFPVVVRGKVWDSDSLSDSDTI